MADQAHDTLPANFFLSEEEEAALAAADTTADAAPSVPGSAMSDTLPSPCGVWDTSAAMPTDTMTPAVGPDSGSGSSTYGVGSPGGPLSASLLRFRQPVVWLCQFGPGDSHAVCAGPSGSLRRSTFGWVVPLGSGHPPAPFDHFARNGASPGWASPCGAGVASRAPARRSMSAAAATVTASLPLACRWRFAWKTRCISLCCSSVLLFCRLFLLVPACISPQPF